MKLNELFDKIEHPKFAVQLSVCSGFSTVLMALEESTELKQLIELLHGSEEARKATYERLMTVLADRGSPGTQHQYDEAITGYLYALWQVDQPLAEQAREQIWHVPNSNIWWAGKLAIHIQKENRAS